MGESILCLDVCTSRYMSHDWALGHPRHAVAENCLSSLFDTLVRLYRVRKAGRLPSHSHIQEHTHTHKVTHKKAKRTHYMSHVVRGQRYYPLPQQYGFIQITALIHQQINCTCSSVPRAVEFEAQCQYSQSQCSQFSLINYKLSSF